MTRAVLLIACVLGPLLVGGCARLRQEAAPAGWPEEWEGRRLARSKYAWVYAGSPGAGEDAAALCESAGRKFRSLTGRELPMAVVVVVDRGEEFPTLKRPIEERVRKEVPAERDRGGNDETRRKALASQEVAAITEAFVSVMRVSLDGDQRAELGSLPGSVAEAGYPVLIIPTTRAIRDAVGKLVRAGMARADLSAAGRIAAGPIAAWARSTMVEAITESHRQSVMIAGQGALDATGRAALEAYIRSKTDEYVGLLPEPGQATPRGLDAGPSRAPSPARYTPPP